MSVPLPRSPRREPDGVAPTKGTRWQRFARYAVAYYGGTCHICGHGGAVQADHLESVADRPDLAWDLRNIRPAHGAGRQRNPCPVCSPAAGRPVYCNQLRGAMSIERARRIIAEWAAAGKGTRPAARPEPESQAGRPWLPPPSRVAALPPVHRVVAPDEPAVTQPVQPGHGGGPSR